MKAKELIVGTDFVADWQKDWRQHLLMPGCTQLFHVDAISIDNEKVIFETGKKNPYFGYIMFIQKDGNTICLNPEEEVVVL